MKKNLKVVLSVLLLSVSLIGCSKDEDVTANEDGKITVTISNYVSGNLDAVKTDSQSFAVGSDGKFSMTLSTPTLSSWEDNEMEGVTISDKAAQIGIANDGGYFSAYKGTTEVGIVMKTNATSYISFLQFSNLIFSIYMYSDRACTIKGTDSDKTTYDVKLTKGWNEVAMKYIDEEHLSVSTTIPSNLKWYFFDMSAMYVKKYQSPKFVQ